MEGYKIKPLCFIVLLMIISTLFIYLKIEIYKNISKNNLDNNNLLGINYKLSKNDMIPIILISAPSFAKLLIYLKS